MSEDTSGRERSKRPPAEAVRFLELIAPGETKFTFQTFDDVIENGRKRKRSALVRIMHGTLKDLDRDLQALNTAGAGIYVTVNETDFGGRERANIKKVRCAFADLDGAPLAPLTREIDPTVVVESSPGKFQVHFRVTDFPLADFEEIQKSIAVKFGGDQKVIDLPRVMRLPGYYHMKRPEEPFLCRMVSEVAEVSYTLPELRNKLGAPERRTERRAREAQARRDTVDPADLCAAAMERLDDWVPHYFPGARREGTGAWRVTSEMLGRELEEDLSIHPEGIKDWGMSDQEGETREGRRTPIEVLMEYGDKLTFEAAVAWLSERVGFAGLEADRFWYYEPDNVFIYAPTGTQWGSPGIINRFTKRGKEWIQKNHPINSLIWAPGEPLIVKDRALQDGGWFRDPGHRCLNLFKPAIIKRGESSRAQGWVSHIRRVFPQDAEHILNFFAYTVQRPEDKINHALVLFGAPGIGKDTILAPLVHAVGPWNCQEISPNEVFGSFNTYQKCKLLRISELGNLGDKNKYQFYEATKTLLAAPPEAVRVNQKHMAHVYVPNICSVIMTMNGTEGSLHLVPNDRRHYVAESSAVAEDFNRFYFSTLYAEYRSGGYEAIAAWLHERDVSEFQAKEPPLKTEAFWRIVDVNVSPESEDIRGILEELGNPSAFTLQQLIEKAELQMQVWLENPSNRRQVGHRIGDCGYTKIKNSESASGLWRIKNKKQMVYVRSTLSGREQYDAAKALKARLEAPPRLVT
jgi:hypothetical protein